MLLYWKLNDHKCMFCPIKNGLILFLYNLGMKLKYRKENGEQFYYAHLICAYLNGLKFNITLN
jgi:hypothetical protein